MTTCCTGWQGDGREVKGEHLNFGLKKTLLSDFYSKWLHRHLINILRGHEQPE